MPVLELVQCSYGGPSAVAIAGTTLSAPWDRGLYATLCPNDTDRLTKPPHKRGEMTYQVELSAVLSHSEVGGSNLGQTQVELSGLNCVSPELGPPMGVAEYIH